MEKHCAYNLTTGEILACSAGNHLKRCVAIRNRTDLKYYPHGTPNEWIFGHTGLRELNDKANRILTQRMRG